MSYENDMRLFRLMMRCSHILHHRKQRYPGQGRLLTLLEAHGSMTQRELLALTEIRSASLSELLEKMESSGLIMREKNDEDKRNIDISLTAAGREAAALARQERDETAHRLFSVLDAERQAELESILECLLDAWQAEKPEKQEE